MARGVGRGASGSELQQDTDLPQSTLAAQLVDRFTDGKKHSKSQDQETFQLLLREILGCERGQKARGEALENNKDVDCKLIYVIVKAGLEKPTFDDPFNGQVGLTKPVIDSMTAIEFTIRRNPEVLFAFLPNQEHESRSVGPLYMWLLPKVLAIIGSTDKKEVIDTALQVLKTALVTERKTHIKGLKIGRVLKYVKGCITDVLSHLESKASELTGSNKLFFLGLPSTTTISSIFRDYSPPNGLQDNFQVTLKDDAQAIITTMRLLSLFTTPSSEERGVIPVVATFVSNDGWLLNTLVRLWDATASNDTQFHHVENPSLFLLPFLDFVRSLCNRVTKAKSYSSIQSRASLLRSQLLLNFLCHEPLPLDPLVETWICLTLFDLVFQNRKSRSGCESVSQNNLPVLLDAREDQKRVDGFGRDLQHALAIVIRLLDSNSHSNSETLLGSQSESFENADLQRICRSHFCESGLDLGHEDHFRAPKRARLSVTNGDNKARDGRSHVVKRIYSLLGLQESTVSTGLSQVTDDSYLTLSEDDQCSLYGAIGQVACESTRSATDNMVVDRNMLWKKCCICDADVAGSGLLAPWEGPESEEMFSAITYLIKLLKKQNLRRPRVAAMLALKRLLSHTINKDHLNITTSTPGQWCLQALHSSIRELRVAAGRTLPVFLRGPFNSPKTSKNWITVLESLRTLSDQRDLALQETTILAWGQIARIAGGDEMNLVLIKLVKYLGHTNALISGLAYDEVQRISNHSQYSALKLFAPYWRTIAITVVEDIQRRPQTVQQMSDLLAMSVSDFLSMTQVHTVPFFVLTKRQEILQRIADACGQSIMVLCREHNNLAAILSCVLLRSSHDVETLVMALLNAISPEFSNVDCAELLKSEPQATASELLRAAGEEDDAKRSKAYQALHFLAGITHGRAFSSRGTARKRDVIGPFFETHVLGIMALLADTINDGKGPQPILEKIRCLGAIREMIKLAKSHVSNGLPQICACLRSAIENQELSNQGFDTWIVMMGTLGEEEIATLADPTFAIIVQHWDSFSTKIQGQAYDMISYLLKSHSSMIRDIVQTLPSLASVPLMAKFEEELGKLRAQMDVKHHFQAFSHRCQSDNATVVLRALEELAAYLMGNQGFLHEAASSEQPDPVVGQLIRSILDTSVLFGATYPEIAVLCAKSIGYVGCLDPTRVEAVRDKKDILVLSNFVRADETNDFVVFFLREILVKAFLSATNSRSQGFLAYAMQELLRISEIKDSVGPRPRDAPFDANYRRWVSLPESVRTTLMPFTNSKYFVTAGISQPPCTYPLYEVNMGHGQWLRTFTFDLLKKRVGEGKVQIIFSVLSRIVRLQDLSISNFLLPFACLNVIINSSNGEKLEVGQELLHVLREPLPDQRPPQDNIILCSQTVFQVLDYLSRWMQEKKKEITNIKSAGTRAGQVFPEADLEKSTLEIQNVDAVLAAIPADVISRRAVECKSYSRALFHWEQFIRQQRDYHRSANQEANLEPLYERLQQIYTQIDEPDGIEGISAHLQVLNIDQQILEHRKAGRWTAAQSWYELLLTQKPDDLDVQYNLLTSLRESGQHDVLLNQIEGFTRCEATNVLSLPFAAEACWVTGKWEKLREYLSLAAETSDGDFNVGIGRALLALSEGRVDGFSDILAHLRRHTARSLSTTNTASLQDCHDLLLRFHALSEMETISGVQNIGKAEKYDVMVSMNQRLDVLGPFLSDKQYLLGLRRATMQLSSFSNLDVASAWLTSAKLARKGNFTHQAFNAVLHASQLAGESATIEHSRLLWREGNHRKAIQSLEGAIAANAFRSHDYSEAEESMVTNNPGRQQQQQNLLKARAHLLLAKWIDRAGQTQSDVIINQYKKAAEFHNRWEKGHYYLGKHYNKLLESEKAKQPWKQAQTFITGETAKLVVENYLRSLAFGAKYIYQTLPRILTLWLDLGSVSEQPLDPKYGNDETFRAHTMAQRRKLLSACNSQIRKYIDRLPAFAFYTAFSQIVARICHSNQAVYNLLVDIVAKVVISHTPQALWTLLAVVKSSSKERANRGVACMARIMESAKKTKADSTGLELKALIMQGQKLSDQLLHVCEGDIHGKPTNISLAKDLGFNHKTASCKLAIPLESSLTASLPTTAENVNMRAHKAFNSGSYIHISSFLDDVAVLNSLQRPRKISIRGSDGHIYALLCKPKDDLRKDQRLMEFNAMINRALKKDADSSKRRLYIKTYAVTPLNEECGLIEWIDNLKTLREILLNSYKQKNVQVNYSELRALLNESVSAPSKLPIFTEKIIPHFIPVFHEWFIEMFPEPGAWFTARLRYTRSCAVMSIVGHVLGLGDRHGENILFEEGNGGTFHVDFNCLFDKGLTFEKPELVPFRLTHNMVDAFGAYGYEGPFRKSCELTLGILRQNEDTLMTILETFLYDPTTDFIGKKKKTMSIVPDTPQGVLESVRNKVRGLLPLESVPLSVEGYVQALIQQATDPFKLASMYIGWCAFF